MPGRKRIGRIWEKEKADCNLTVWFFWIYCAPPKDSQNLIWQLIHFMYRKHGINSVLQKAIVTFKILQVHCNVSTSDDRNRINTNYKIPQL